MLKILPRRRMLLVFSPGDNDPMTTHRLDLYSSRADNWPGETDSRCAQHDDTCRSDFGSDQLPSLSGPPAVLVTQTRVVYVLRVRGSLRVLCSVLWRKGQADRIASRFHRTPGLVRRIQTKFYRFHDRIQSDLHRNGHGVVYCRPSLQVSPMSQFERTGPVGPTLTTQRGASGSCEQVRGHTTRFITVSTSAHVFPGLEGNSFSLASFDASPSSSRGLLFTTGPDSSWDEAGVGHPVVRYYIGACRFIPVPDGTCLRRHSLAFSPHTRPCSWMTQGTTRPGGTCGTAASRRRVTTWTLYSHRRDPLVWPYPRMG